MDINARISRYYQDYKADMDAARLAENRGNLEGAYKLYRQAARDLCEMAALESGETKKERTLHAEQVLKKAEALKRAGFTVRAGETSVLAGQSFSSCEKTQASASPSRSDKQAVNSGTDEGNPWQDEGVPSTTFDDVIGMEDVKKLIRSRVIDQIRYPDLYAQYGLKGGTGVLLFGLPGTGKTTIARAIAHEIGAPLYTVKISDILSKWVGESEKRISQLFDKARQSPISMIFFDDFDALGTERQEDSQHAHSNKIIVEMINQMDGFHQNTNTIVMLAATNKPWMIDSALMRPGRFEHHIYVPLANHDARIALVKHNLGSVPTEPGMDFDRISDLLTGYNGADIVSVVSSAKLAAVQRAKEFKDRGEEGYSPVCFDDFSAAAAGHKSSVNPNDIVKLRKYAAERDIVLPNEL